MKKYLLCKYRTPNGEKVKRELTLSDSRLVSQMAQDAGKKGVTVQLMTCTAYRYSRIFNQSFERL